MRTYPWSLSRWFLLWTSPSDKSVYHWWFESYCKVGKRFIHLQVAATWWLEIWERVTLGTTSASAWTCRTKTSPQPLILGHSCSSSYWKITALGVWCIIPDLWTTWTSLRFVKHEWRMILRGHYVWIEICFRSKAGCIEMLDRILLRSKYLCSIIKQTCTTCT